MTVTVLGFSALTWAAHARLGSHAVEAMKLLDHRREPQDRARRGARAPGLPRGDAAGRAGRSEGARGRRRGASSSPPATAWRSPSPPTTQRDPQAIVDGFLADHKGVGAARASGRTSTATRAATPSITCSAWPPAWIPWWWASRRFWASSRRPTPRPRTAARCAAGWTACCTRAFSVAKRVRSETGIGQMAVSVSYAAVELARKIFGSLANRTIMIVGAGKMSELAARHLRRSGASHVFVTNRTHERAVEMAAAVPGHAGRIHALRQHAARRWIS